MTARILFVSILFGGMALAPAARGQVSLLHETFDGVAPPAAPPGWTFGEGWETDASAASPGSGANNITVDGGDSSAVDTPEFDLSAARRATLSYLGRRSGTFDISNLRVLASADGGSTFPITLIPAGSAIPVDDLTYELFSVDLPAALLGEPRVVIRIESLGASAGNVRIDDIAVSMSVFDPALGNGVLSFGSVTSIVDSGLVEVPIALEFDASDSLQGIQFRVSWGDAPLTAVDVVPGAALADSNFWSVSHESDDESVKVVVLGQGTTAIPSGIYAPLLTIVWAPGVLEGPTPLSLSGVIASLASPEGLDAEIVGSPLQHTLSSVSDVPSFEPSTFTLDLGTVAVGESATAALSVGNTMGTVDLIISEVTGSNPLYSVVPTTAIIPPGGSQEFLVTFAPTDTAFGLQTGELLFVHNADTGSTAIALTGIGTGGRGDVDGDGAVDVLDVIYSIDIVLDRITPSPEQLAAADLYPFGAGDLSVDVRDLTVLTQAIARGMWPDSVALPIEFADPEGEPAARVAFSRDDASTIRLEHDVPIRGFQLVIPSESYDSTRLQVDGMKVVSGYDARRKEIRVLAYVPGGGTIAEGKLQLRFDSPLERPRYVAVIDAENRRVSVETSSPVAIEPDDRPEPSLIAPYPNPYRPGTDALQLGRHADVRIYDLLGRKIYSAKGVNTWDGRNASGQLVAPGLYILQLDAEGTTTTRLITIVR